MKPTLRNMERKSYAQPKHMHRGKKSDQKVGNAIIVDSGNRNVRNPRKLIIGHDLFKPQGTPAAGNVYYKCEVKGCHARAIISQLDLEKGFSCAVKLTNEHSHAPETECFLTKGGHYSDSDEGEETGSDFVEESASAWSSVADEPIFEFVDVNSNNEQEDDRALDYVDESMQNFDFVDLNNNFEWKSQEAEEKTPETNPLEILSQSSPNSATTSDDQGVKVEAAIAPDAEA